MERILGTTPPYVFLPLIKNKSLLVGPSLVNPDLIEIYTNPKYWTSLNAKEVLRIRKMGQTLLKPTDPIKGLEDSSVKKLQEISLYEGKVDLEVEYLKTGPRIISDPFEGFHLNKGNLSRILTYSGGTANKIIEKVYEDKELTAKEAVITLDKSGLSVYKIQQLLSVGALGVKRKLVATRWSITAVDSLISSEIINKIKEYQEISEIYVGESYLVGNKILVILSPGKFYFEMLESWGPYLGERQPSVAMDFEGFLGRKKYAEEVEGAYYAARYSVAKYLEKIKRQASVLVFLEVGKEWIPGLGVWRVREGTEIALMNLKKFDSFPDALKYVFSKTYTLDKAWLNSSFYLRQTKLDAYADL